MTDQSTVWTLTPTSWFLVGCTNCGFEVSGTDLDELRPVLEAHRCFDGWTLTDPPEGDPTP